MTRSRPGRRPAGQVSKQVLIGQGVLQVGWRQAAFDGAQADARTLLYPNTVLPEQGHVYGDNQSLGRLTWADALEAVLAHGASLPEADVTQGNRFWKLSWRNTRLVLPLNAYVHGRRHARDIKLEVHHLAHGETSYIVFEDGRS